MSLVSPLLPPPLRAALTVGIGCRRGVSIDEIEAAVHAALGERALDHVDRVATIASKADEPALIAFCTHYRLPLTTFSSDVINACLEANPTLAASPAARRHQGVRGVCEPCALLATPGGQLVVGKQTLGRVAVAIAAVPEP
ncbi:cobalamin biosynthesis protein [Trinickia sp. LjRoot230]|uniref:cobalamin biosynthesis protein n=1 Tax=Trinickia sp. LjRoot230 TaxID=3342288 RepID=UPI003ECDB85D